MEIEVSKVSHHYGSVRALDHVDLTIQAGEIVALVGPSGCGKSTLLRIVAGLQDLQEGTVLFDSRNVARMPTEKRKLSMVFQEPSLFPHMKVYENIAFAMPKSAKKRQRAEVDEMLVSVGLQGRGASYPHMLSGGQQQRVSLVRALAAQPKLILLDEPFSKLDVTLRKSMREEALSLIKSQGISALLVTHDPEDALRMADRIYVMQEGAITQFGAAPSLYEVPVNRFVAAFFGQLNYWKVCVEGGQVNTIIGRFVATNMIEGSQVEVCIRPEHIKLNIKKVKNGLKACVENIAFLGLSTIVYVRIVGHTGQLKVRVLSQEAPKIGDTVYVKAENDDVMVFPTAR